MKNSKGGKQAAKGIKQILEDNKSTIDFYYKLILSLNSAWILIRLFIFWDSFTLKYMILHLVATSFAFISYYYMKSMATPILNEQNAIIDPGCDLNMEGHISEYFKDIMIFTSGVQLLALITNYAWLLMLVIPGYAFYKLWVLVIGPWIFAPAPEEPLEEDGKGKKGKIKRR